MRAGSTKLTIHIFVHLFFSDGRPFHEDYEKNLSERCVLNYNLCSEFAERCAFIMEKRLPPKSFFSLKTRRDNVFLLPSIIVKS